MGLANRKGILALLLPACAAIPAHAPVPPGPPPTSVTEAENTYGRHVVAAEGIEIHATLWDAALVAAAAAEDGDATVWPDGWKATYLDRTSFTVVVEVEDRLPALDLRIARASSWWFRLDRGAHGAAKAQEVRLLLADRFPTSAGTHHHRLVFAVHFDGPVEAPSVLKLRVGIAAAKDDKRPMTGHVLRGRGAALRFVVAPLVTPPHPRPAEAIPGRRNASDLDGLGQSDP